MLRLTPISHARRKGLRPYQEDRFFTASMPEGFCFGVFDGHGGVDCAKKATRMFPSLLADAVGEPDATIPDALREVFARVNKATKDLHDGCTASIVFIPSSCDAVHVAVLGDSPVIVGCRESIWVSPEHNVRSNKAEAEAAKDRGGCITSDGYLVRGFSGSGLQMSRALGDVWMGSLLLRTPDVSTHALEAGSFVLVCSDGALDPGHIAPEASAQSVVELIQSGSDAKAIANRAVRIPTEDNVTVLLTWVEAHNEVRTGT
jgi:serine/threonine protein phosphatase PrpC